MLKCQQFINVKMPTIVGILTFMSRKIFMFYNPGLCSHSDMSSGGSLERIHGCTLAPRICHSLSTKVASVICLFFLGRPLSTPQRRGSSPPGGTALEHFSIESVSCFIAPGSVLIATCPQAAHWNVSTVAPT